MKSALEKGGDWIKLGRRVALRPFTPHDASAIRMWMDHPQVGPYYGFGRDQVAGRRPRHGIGTYIIVLLDGRRSLGFVELDDFGTRYDISIAIGIPEFHGKGLGDEAMTLAIDYAFTDLGWDHLGLQVFGFNKRAIRLYERLGFQVRRNMKERVIWQGRKYDWLFMVLMRNDWSKDRPIPGRDRAL